MVRRLGDMSTMRRRDVAGEARVEAEHLLQDAQPQARPAEARRERVQLAHVRQAVARLLRLEQIVELVPEVP